MAVRCFIGHSHDLHTSTLPDLIPWPATSGPNQRLLLRQTFLHEHNYTLGKNKLRRDSGEPGGEVYDLFQREWFGAFQATAHTRSRSGGGRLG